MEDYAIEALIHVNSEIGSLGDIVALRHLLRDSGFRTEEEPVQSEDDMGFDYAWLTVLIPFTPQLSLLIKLFSDILKEWIVNRNTKVIIKNKKTGRSVEFESASGISTSKLKMCFDYTNEDD